MRRSLILFAILLTIAAAPALAGLPGEAINGLIRIPLPAKMDICGDQVPLDREDVAERLDYELTIMLGNPVQTSLWLKRFPRYFPEVERELRQRGLPDDLKYVAVIESSLRADAISSAGAVGPWQFMPATGRDYGLDRKSWVDERRDWGLSTRAALNFLKELHDRWGDWALTLASYNCGPGRVRSAMESQRHADFWGLVLPEETERYVFRFLAAKLIFTQPASFGIDLNQAKLYDDRGLRTVTVEVRNKLTLLAAAKAAGLSYRYFLELNPNFTGSELPKGTHAVRIPGDRVEQFEMAAEGWKKAAPEQTAAKEKSAKGAKPQKPVPVLTADIKPSTSTIRLTPQPVQTPPSVIEPPPAQAEAPALQAPESQLSQQVPPADQSAPPVLNSTVVFQGQLDAPAPRPPSEVSQVQAAASETPQNVAPTPEAGQVALSEPIAQGSIPDEYTVQKGDTLSSISRKFSVPVERLRVENGLDATGSIKPGQSLKIPR